MLMQNIYIIQQFGGYNEIKDEKTPIIGGRAEFIVEQSGITNITASVGIGKYASSTITKTVRLDNIKPEITNVNLTPTPRKSR